MGTSGSVALIKQGKGGQNLKGFHDKRRTDCSRWRSRQKVKITLLWIELLDCRQSSLMVGSDIPLEISRMAKIPPMVPLSDLRRAAVRVLRLVRSSDRPVFLTQRGRATAVLMSIDAFERSAIERELLLLLAQGEKEITSGAGHDLESVLSEADKVLALG
jgi:prevent-host-death family protein